jgi:hypothetical protein
LYTCFRLTQPLHQNLCICEPAIPLLGILGLSGWLAFVRPEILPLASAYAAKMVCSNVFIANAMRMR